MEDCWRIVAAQERTGLVYLLGEQVRHSGFITAWRDLVQSGKLGHVGYVEGEYMSRKDTRRYWRDFETAEFVDLKDLHKVPWAQKTWTHDMPPIHYLCHDLSAMLSILDDRVVRVTAMSTQADGYAHDEIVRPDIQVGAAAYRQGHDHAHGVRMDHRAVAPDAGPPVPDDRVSRHAGDGADPG